MADVIKLIIGRSLIGSKGLTVNRIIIPTVGWLKVSSPGRAMATSSAAIVERISENLSFRPGRGNSSFNSDNRPIVLIYAWLAAKSKHIHKFGDFYVGKGFDVLHVKVTPSQLMWPQRAQTVAAQIVEFVTSPPRNSQPILVHGFSVGGYLYGETLVNITRDPAKTKELTKRVRGQVFDSPVDFEGVPRGVSQALLKSSAARFALRTSIESYLALFQKQVTQHYVRSSQTFHANPLRTPSLILYSYADVVGTAGPIETLMGNWRKVGVPVFSRVWQDTEHVAHYLRDPVNYTMALNDFLQKIGIEQGEQAESERQPLVQSKL